ncbi:MAG: hypothetical protein AB8B63_16660 [Granulosicoccus sp.]
MFRFSYHGGSIEQFPYRQFAATKNREQAPFDFKNEALRYFQITRPIRKEDEIEITEKLAKNISFNDNVDIISIIPCHVDEVINYRSLGRHIEIFSKSGGHVVIYVNDSREHKSRTSIEAKMATMRSSLDKVSPVGCFQIVGSMYSAKKTIGAIRGLVNDAVIKAAMDANLDDPIAVSNDIDIDHTQDNYVHRIRENFQNDCLDVLTGPLYYGYTTEGAEFGQRQMLAPELVLANRLLDARKSIRLKGALDGGRFFATEGPHTVYRLSSYCAVGGYDFSMTLSEDDELGMALFRLRTTKENRYPKAVNAQYDDEFWLTTNARRQLQAIVSGYSVTDTWVHYPIDELMGQNIDIDALLEKYWISEKHLQVTDYSTNLQENVPEKVNKRIARTLDIALKDVHLDIETAHELCRVYGVKHVDLVSASNRYKHMKLEPEMIAALLHCRSNSPAAARKLNREPA